MNAKRALLASLLVVMLLLSSLPAAQAQRACADALARCGTACAQQFGGGIFGSIMTEGCYAGCNIGYVWCVASN